MDDYQEHLDPEIGLTYLEGPGVFVVAVEAPVDVEAIARAATLLVRLRRDPLEVAAMIVADAYRFPAADVNRLAESGIVVGRVAAETAKAGAVKYIEQFLELRSAGLKSLQTFAEKSLRESKRRRRT